MLSQDIMTTGHMAGPVFLMFQKNRNCVFVCTGVPE